MRSKEQPDEATGRERARCAELCRRRSTMWRSTALASSPSPAAREEARARANEAAYLADLIESGEDLAPPADA
ncbi:MAG TPA: hypothetical protein VNA04_02955 [Thermoanaerobaculia bacterium]|nr:hypothetical protein [Thermoanaerobaculia bacterium]